MYADSGGIYGLWQRSFTSLKKRKRDKTFDRQLGIAFRSDMSSKEISLVCKINIFYITKETNKNHRGQVNRPARVNQGTCPCDPLSLWPVVDNRWNHGVKLLHDWKNASKRCEFFWFYLYLCHVLLRFMLVLNCNTKISEKSDMAKSWALGFAACHKQELFVAQELINKIKCCGIKDPIYKNHRKALSWLSWSCGNNLQFCWLSWWLRWNINVSWNNIK